MKLRDIDVLISATTKFPECLRLLTFHRCVADEIHKYGFHDEILTDKMWGITATPLKSPKYAYRMGAPQTYVEDGQSSRRKAPLI